MPRKQIQSTRENIRLSIVYPVYKQRICYTKMPDGELIPERKEKLIKEMTLQKWFKKDAIISVEEYVTSGNKIAKTRSVIFDRYSGKSFATFHSPAEIINTIHSELKTITGFSK